METRTQTWLSEDVEIRQDSAGGRTLTGILVPWGKKAQIRGGTEEFARGAFAKQMREPHRIPLMLGHGPAGGKPIGRVLELRDDNKGLYGEAKVSETRDGDDTLALLRDGAMAHWSIGFYATKDRVQGSHIVRQSARLFELAVVPQGAYGDLASVAKIRGACHVCGHVEEEVRAVEEDMAEVDAIIASLAKLKQGWAT